jgi:hypothetical protein
VTTVQNQSQPGLGQVRDALVARGWISLGQVVEIGQETLVVDNAGGSTTLTLTLTTARRETGTWRTELVLQACADLSEPAGWGSPREFIEWVVLRYGFVPRGVAHTAFPAHTITARWLLQCTQAILPDGEVYAPSIAEIAQPFMNWTGIGDARCAYRSPAILVM